MSKVKTSPPMIFSAAGFPVSRIVSRAKEKHRPTKEIFGESLPGLFASVTPDGSWLKMSQGYYQARLDGSLVEFSAIWPQAGMMSNGKAYRLPRLVRRISGKEYSLLPTLRAKESGEYQYSLGDHDKKVGYVRMYPTPTASQGHKKIRKFAPSEAKGTHGKVLVGVIGEQSPALIGGYLNPEFCEWLMGFPIGWTELEDLETP